MTERALAAAHVRIDTAGCALEPTTLRPGRLAMVASCYHIGMSKQIAVRLPDELVEFVDRTVASGDARSRASVVRRALERERRRAIAEKDVEILARTGADPELAGLAEHAAGMPSKLA